jgi:hypothetical protein
LSSNEYVEPNVRFSAGDGDKSSPDHLTISKPNDNEGRNDKVHRSSSVKRVERTSSAGLTGRPATADGAILRSDRSSSSSQVSGIRSSDNNLTKAEKSSGNLMISQMNAPLNEYGVTQHCFYFLVSQMTFLSQWMI